MQNAVVGGDDEFVGVQALGGGDQLRGGADYVGLRYHRFGRFRVHQDLGIRVLLTQQFQFDAFELVMHQAGALPQQHVGASLLLYIAAQMLIGRPQDFFALGMQMRHDVEPDGRRDHPVGARFDGGTCIGVHHYGAIRVGIAKGGKLIGRTTQVERTGGIQVGHQHALVRAQDF